MHDAMLYWVMLPAARDLVDGGGRAEGELPTFGAHASYNVYRTADGQLVALGALERKFWATFCAGIGRPDLAARHATGEPDQLGLITEMRELFATRTRDEWLALMANRDVCLTPVNTPREALRDPHVMARGLVQRAAGMQVVRPPFLSRIPDLSPPPTVGQHTREVVASLPAAGG
jgi:alpha-methylacyl-CoA racemase